MKIFTYTVLFQDLISGVLDRDEGESSVGHDEGNYSVTQIPLFEMSFDIQIPKGFKIPYAIRSQRV